MTAVVSNAFSCAPRVHSFRMQNSCLAKNCAKSAYKHKSVLFRIGRIRAEKDQENEAIRSPILHGPHDGLDEKISLIKALRDFVCAPCAVTNVSAVHKRCVAPALTARQDASPTLVEWD